MLRAILERRVFRRRSVEENEGTNRLDPFADVGSIWDGTVGWDDGSQHYDILAEGRTLVRVTLFVGRDPREVVRDDGLAHGRRILARVGAPMFRIPPRGTEVHVSIPAGRWDSPGAGVILCELQATPANQFSERTTKLDFGPDANLVIKAGQIALTDYENRYISVSPQGGIKMADQDGSMISILNKKIQLVVGAGNGAATPCLMELAEGKVRINVKTDAGQGGLVLNPDQFACTAKSFKAACSNGMLGVSAIASNGIAYSPAGPANVVSTSWFVSS